MRRLLQLWLQQGQGSRPIALLFFKTLFLQLCHGERNTQKEVEQRPIYVSNAQEEKEKRAKKLHGTGYIAINILIGPEDPACFARSMHGSRLARYCLFYSPAASSKSLPQRIGLVHGSCARGKRGLGPILSRHSAQTARLVPPPRRRRSSCCAAPLIRT